MTARSSLVLGSLVLLLSGSSAAAAPSPIAVPGGVHVTIEAPNYALGPSLDQRQPDGSWIELCTAPCTNATIDARGTYRVHGGEIHKPTSCRSDDDAGDACEERGAALPSGPFHLANGPREQRLFVEGVLERRRTLGLALAPISVLWFAPAAVAFAGGFEHDKAYRNTVRWAVGLPATAVGIAWLTVGLVLATRSTHVKDEEGRVLGRVKLPHGIALTSSGFVF